MSADNGVYIGIFPNKSYRVIYTQCIDNCDDVEYLSSDNTDLYRVVYWKDAPEFSTFEDAANYASELAETYSYLEYGVSIISYSRPLLDMDSATAADKLGELE